MLLYVISEGVSGPCKIGFGAAPHRRLINLQIGNSRPLAISSTWLCPVRSVQACEKMLHHHFGRRHLRGEWFDVLSSEVEEACLLIGMVHAESAYDYSRKPKPGDTRLSWLV